MGAQAITSCYCCLLFRLRSAKAVSHFGRPVLLPQAVINDRKLIERLAVVRVQRGGPLQPVYCCFGFSEFIQSFAPDVEVSGRRGFGRPPSKPRGTPARHRHRRATDPPDRVRPVVLRMIVLNKLDRRQEVLYRLLFVAKRLIAEAEIIPGFVGLRIDSQDSLNCPAASGMKPSW